MTNREAILVVDDDPINTSIMEEVLGDTYLLKTATSGLEALELMDTFCPDLVLLDIMMPGMTGYETCKQIRSKPSLKYLKVVLVSAKATVSERLKGYEVGADDYVTKPFNHQELLAKVKVFLRLKSAEEVIQLKNDILGLMVHETNTPLSAIFSPAELLLTDGPVDEAERKELARTILENAERLKGLFDKVLLLSGFRAGDRDLQLEPVDLNELVRMSAEAAQVKTVPRGIRIRSKGAGVVVGDARYLRFVLDALVDNAVRFSSDGCEVGVEISVGRDETQLRVTDHGKGISPDVLPRLFDELEDADLIHHADGQKLSLAISRAIIRRHGGEIDVRSSPESGTTFTVRLPRTVSPDGG
jgi:two-component system sensor histidine kinase/response regulator